MPRPPPIIGGKPKGTPVPIRWACGYGCGFEDNDQFVVLRHTLTEHEASAKKDGA